jgi:two-component system sensor histidine kinase QseC
MKTFSIRRRLLLTLLAGLALVWVAMLALGYQKAREEIHELSDARLQQAARTLLVLDLKRLGRLVRSEADAHDLPDSEQADEAPPLAFQAWNEHGQLLIDNADAPAAAFDPREGFATRTLEGQAWRSYSVRDRKHGYLLTVLEPLAVRDHPVHGLAARMGQVLLLALPILAALIWLTIHRGLLPLERLSAAIAIRDARALEPIAPAQLPGEAAQLVAALNALLARLRQSLETERAFTADAAHELRTPLAAIKVQAEVALASTHEAERRQALQQLIAGVDRATHLVQQLLQLARIEHGSGHLHQAIALDELAAQAIAAQADQAVQRGMELSLDAGTPGSIAGDPAMLRILIDNLIDNALKYGRSGGTIEVRIRPDESGPVLTVVDDGEGVSAADLARLHDRFFRIEGTSASGSGLGLSIVEKIAAAHHAKVEFHSGIGGRGLGVSVRFGEA